VVIKVAIITKPHVVLRKKEIWKIFIVCYTEIKEMGNKLKDWIRYNHK
jgi:hypothetical protein